MKRILHLDFGRLVVDQEEASSAGLKSFDNPKTTIAIVRTLDEDQWCMHFARNPSFRSSYKASWDLFANFSLLHTYLS